MEITKLSSKGQVVIPESIRTNMEIGTSFSVVKVNDLIVLRPMSGLSEQEESELKELNKIWKEFESGKTKTYSEDEFFAKMKQW